MGRKETQRGGTYNSSGNSERKLGIQALEERGASIRVANAKEDVPKDEVCITGWFVYTMKNEPLQAGRSKTGAYIDHERRLDDRFFANGCQVPWELKLRPLQRNYRV